MKSLTGSSLNLFLVKYKLKDIGNMCCTRPRNVGLSRPQKSHFLGLPQQHEASFTLTHPRFSLSVLSSSDIQTELQDKDNAEDNPNPHANESESVRVKFELLRECLFGQNFVLVGDDPTFGSWDPSNAIPLSWSDGHVWYVELDICVGKSIKYKFILDQGDGTILWQPGEDRVLQTFRTAKTIKVTNTWDNLESEVVEEESSTALCEQIVANSDMRLVAENLTVMREYQENTIDKDKRDDEETSSRPVLIPSLENLKETEATDTNVEKGEVEVVTERIENDVNKNELPHPYSAPEIDENMASKAKNNGNVDYSEEFPVLVPGLTPLTNAESEEPEAGDIKQNALAADDIHRESDIIEQVNVLELCGSSHERQNLEEEPEESINYQIASTAMINGNAIQHAVNTQAAKDNQVLAQPLAKDYMKCNLQWGRETLQKILTSLGLL